MATIKDSQRQERTLAKEVAGSVNAGSGNGWVRKGDVRSDKELWECKVTSAKSFSLKHADLRTVFEQALMDGRIPVFLVEFIKQGESFVVLTKDDYMEMRSTYFGNETTDAKSEVVPRG
jgi:hypothetical protein